MPEYRLTPKAKEDMEAVWLYSLSQWGMAQTSRYIDDLVDAFLFLTETPKAGSAAITSAKAIENTPSFATLFITKKPLMA